MRSERCAARGIAKARERGWLSQRIDTMGLMALTGMTEVAAAQLLALFPPSATNKKKVD